MDWKNLGTILHAEYGMNMTQLAMRVDVTQAAISNLIKGKNQAKPETQKRILEALNLTEEQYTEMSAKLDRAKGERKSTEGKEQNRNALRITYDDDTDRFKAKAAGMRYEDMPDKWVDKMSDAELRVTKERECRGNRCEMCRLQCAIGKELKKRGMLEMKTEAARNDTNPEETRDAAQDAEQKLPCPAEADGKPVTEENKNGNEEQEKTENQETEYPFWMCELLSENAEPDTVEFAMAYWGAIPETVTAAQVAGMKREMMRFERLKNEVGKLLMDGMSK